MQGVSGKRLCGAIIVGVLLEIVLTAFSLHISLWIATLSGSCRTCYWTLVGGVFTIGLATGLGAVPWAGIRPRLIVATLVFLTGLGLGLLSSMR